jgi:tRNA modification GTPase
VLLVLDPKDEIAKEDKEVLSQCKGKHVIVILNKIDTVGEIRLKELESQIKHSCVARTSLISGAGIEDVERIIKQKLGLDKGFNDNETVISQIRQKDILIQTNECLIRSVKEINKGIPIDIAEIEIIQAADHLGELLGENISEEITDKIFSRFCLGK